jgi:glycosyltransferase involved in cell wall biosynthesis
VSGGVKRTLRLVEAMSRAGALPHVVTPDAQGLAADAGAAARAWRTHVVATREPERSIRARMHMRRLPYERDVAAEVGRLTAGAAFAQFEGHNSAPLLPAVHGVPTLYSTHNVDSAIEQARAGAHPRWSAARLRGSYRAGLIRHVERVASRRAEAVLCVSEADAAEFAPLARRVVVAPNGVDDEFFAVAEALPANEDVLFFGQFTYDPNARGIERFLAGGWPRLAAARPAARLLIAGEGATDLLGDAPGERVEVLGLVPSVADTLAACRAVVVPIWLGGGTRLKVLEAMAARRPLVGTALGVGGIGFRDGVHGLVRESPAELADGLAEVLADEERARALAGEAARLAERYAWRSALAPAEELYAELLERPAAGRASRHSR